MPVQLCHNQIKMRGSSSYTQVLQRLPSDGDVAGQVLAARPHDAQEELRHAGLHSVLAS